MLEHLERTAVLIVVKPGNEPALEAALHDMGAELPRMGRFTEAGELMLVRAAPQHVLAMRPGVEDGLMDELAPLAAVAGLIDQSDARVGVRLAGPAITETLARLLPLDLEPNRFGPGQCAQTLAAHLSVLLLRLGPNEFELYCGRSFAGTFFRSIQAAMDTVSA